MLCPIHVCQVGVGHGPGGNACELRITPVGSGQAATAGLEVQSAPMTIAHANGNGYLGIGPNGVPFLLPGEPTDVRGHFKFTPTLPRQPNAVLYDARRAPAAPAPGGGHS